MLAAFLFVPLACVRNWLAGFADLQAERPLVPLTTRTSVPWGLVDLAVILVVVAVITGGGVALGSKAMGIEAPTGEDATVGSGGGEQLLPAEQARVFFAFGTSTLIATAVSFGWLWLRYMTLPGFDRSQLWEDVVLGVRWFTMLIVPVVLLQVILTQWMPTEHPLIQLLRETENVAFLPVAAYAAVITAPIFEEAFFRLFLQGWLEKLQLNLQRIKLGGSSKADNDAVIFGGDLSTGAEDATLQRSTLWTPILVTSALFALAHLGHGPDGIPLFFLAIGLGYLYQRTGRIQACIVVHMLVNALGILQLWVAVRQPQP